MRQCTVLPEKLQSYGNTSFRECEVALTNQNICNANIVAKLALPSVSETPTDEMLLDTLS